MCSTVLVLAMVAVVSQMALAQPTTPKWCPDAKLHPYNNVLNSTIVAIGVGSNQVASGQGDHGQDLFTWDFEVECVYKGDLPQNIHITGVEHLEGCQVDEDDRFLMKAGERRIVYLNPDSDVTYMNAAPTFPASWIQEMYFSCGLHMRAHFPTDVNTQEEFCDKGQNDPNYDDTSECVDPNNEDFDIDYNDDIFGTDTLPLQEESTTLERTTEEKNEEKNEGDSTVVTTEMTKTSTAAATSSKADSEQSEVPYDTVGGSGNMAYLHLATMVSLLMTVFLL